MTEERHDAPVDTEDDFVGQESAEGELEPEGDTVPDEDVTEEELAAPEVELQALRGELEVLEDRYLRTRAEFDNFRRRSVQEQQSAWQRAQADFVKSLLTALDDLQRVGAWEASSTNLEALIEGVDLVERKFGQALRSAGVEILEPEPGSDFDPNTMEAMLRVPTEDPEKDDTVEQVFARGYQLGESLIRAARVAVLKADD